MDDSAKRVQAVLGDMGAIELGDRRLESRAQRIAERLATEPALGFPQAMETAREIEGFYRFIGNEKVTSEAILEPHMQATVARIIERGIAIAVHDTSEFRFPGQGREGLGEVTRAGNMFLGHFCLVLSADGARDPLGVLAIKTWTRSKTSPSSLRKKGVDYKATRSMPSEQDRWLEGIEEAEARVANKAQLIHVMDSESDDYDLIASVHASGRRFVSRSCSNRRLDAIATGSLPGEKLKEFAGRAEIVAQREVKLTRRKRAIAGGTTNRVLPREARNAILTFSATKVAIRRPQYGRTTDETVIINVVSVREKNPPVDMEPVDWLLFTSEPIDTEQQILAVVDIYRARWTIEEYFKVLKTGCAFEQRQLESKTTIVKALALFTPVAWVLLRMRAASRRPERLSISAVLSPAQITILKKRTGIPLRKNSSAAEAYLAVAQLGGHIKNNGPPGWQVLNRGYVKLLTLEAGFKMASPDTCDQ